MSSKHSGNNSNNQNNYQREQSNMLVPGFISSITKVWTRPRSDEELDRESCAWISYLESVFGRQMTLRQTGYIPISTDGNVGCFRGGSSCPVESSSSCSSAQSYLPVNARALVNSFRDGVLFGYLMQDIHPEAFDPATLFHMESSQQQQQHRSGLGSGANNSVLSFVNRLTRRNKSFFSTSVLNSSSCASSLPCSAPSPANSALSSRSTTPTDSSGIDFASPEGQTYFKIISNLNTILLKLTLPPFKILPSSHQFSAHLIYEKGDGDVMMDLIWRVLRAHILRNVNIDVHPELIRLANQSVRELLEASEEEILLRWFNYHLAKAGSRRMVGNFSKDLDDMSEYVMLMSQIAPADSDNRLLQAVLDLDTDLDEAYDENDALNIKTRRASFILENGKVLGVDFIISPSDLAVGHPRIHLLFCCSLFEKFVGIMPLPTEDDLRWIHQEMANMHSRIQMLTSTLTRINEEHEHEKEVLREESLHYQFSLRKQVMAKEAALQDKLFRIEADNNAKLFAEKKRFSDLLELFTRMKTCAEQNLTRTLQFLHAYKDRRKEIFSEANEYIVTTYNNDGKKINFRIFAPQMNQRCSFDFSNLSSAPPTVNCQNLIGDLVSLKMNEDAYDIAETARSSDFAIQTSDDIPELLSSDASTPLSPAPSLPSFKDEFASELFLDPRLRSLSCPPDINLEQSPSATQLHYVPKRQNRPSLSARGSSLGTVTPSTPKHQPSNKKSSTNLSANALQSMKMADTTNVNLLANYASNMEKLTEQLHATTQTIMEENMQQIQQIQLLAAKVDEMNWLNSVMGDKVREFSEDLIRNRKNGNKRSK